MIISTRLSRAVVHPQTIRLFLFQHHHHPRVTRPTASLTTFPHLNLTAARPFSMSSSEGENFGALDVSDSESDGYEPAPKKVCHCIFLNLCRRSRRYYRLPKRRPLKPLYQRPRPQPPKQQEKQRQHRRRRSLLIIMTTQRMLWMKRRSTMSQKCRAKPRPRERRRRSLIPTRRCEPLRSSQYA